MFGFFFRLRSSLVYLPFSCFLPSPPQPLIPHSPSISPSLFFFSLTVAPPLGRSCSVWARRGRASLYHLPPSLIFLLFLPPLITFSPHFSLGSGQPIKSVQRCEEDDLKLLSDESVKGLIAAQHQERGWCKVSDEGVISQGSSQWEGRSDNIRFFQV